MNIGNYERTIEIYPLWLPETIQAPEEPAPVPERHYEPIEEPEKVVVP